MSNDVYVPLALKLHAYGLRRLHDPNWAGMDLYENIRTHVRGLAEPKAMLWKTIENGLLYHLGQWLYFDYIQDDEYEYIVRKARGEYRAWYLEDFVNFIAYHTNTASNTTIKNAQDCLNKIDHLFESDEQAYFEYLHSVEGKKEMVRQYRRIKREFKAIIDENSKLYAVNYADRVFHDRELCGYISQLLMVIGFDGTRGDGSEPKQWVGRHHFPEWAKAALRARERGKCALCGRDILFELEGDIHVDHIVPITKGGCNDLVNLQLMCGTCNYRKGNDDIPATSSIPPYLKRRVVK